MSKNITKIITTIMLLIAGIALIAIPSEAKNLGNSSKATIAVRRTDDYDLHLSGNSNGTPDDTFCVQEGAHVNTGNVYNVKNRIEIDGLDSVVYQGNTNKKVREVKDNINNGIMAWIIAQNDTGSNHVKGNQYYSSKQKAIYGFFRTWKNANGLTKYKTNGGNYANASWVKKGREYAQECNKEEKASIENKTDSKKVKTESYGEYIKVGPFKWEYTGNLTEVKVINQDGKEISAKLAKYKGKKLETIDNISQIKSGKNFYVLIKNDTGATSIQVTGKAEQTKDRYTATIWTLSHKYKENGQLKEGQNIITTISDKKQTSSEDDVKTEPVELYIDLSGYVWSDEIFGKGSTRNEQYKEGEADENDKAVDGIVVYLKDKNGNVVATTTTKEQGLYDEINGGEYKFKNVPIAKLSEYYVEFEYDGLTYINVGKNLDKNNGSKAVEAKNARDNMNKAFSEITGSTNISTIDSKVYASTKEASYSLKDAYTKQGGTEIRYVNLGLISREQPKYGLDKDLSSVDLTINGYGHTYKYDRNEINNKNFVKDANGFNVGVKFGREDKIGSYYRAIYKSDVDYTAEASKELQTYLTYRIELENYSTSLTGRINSIIEYYDQRYEEVKAYKLENVNGQEQKVELTVTQEDKDKYKNIGYSKAIIDTSSIQIGSLNSASIFVQFKLSKEAMLDLLNNITMEGSKDVLLRNVAEINSYTTLDSNGNVYAGYDKDSTPGNAVPGDESTYEDDTGSAPTLKLQYEDNRTLTGKVFLDSTTGELKTGEVRQGDGIYNEGEKGIGGVTVKLVESNGSIEIPETTTDENGDFTFSGFIPGDYTIVYTWGDDNYTVQNYKGTVYDSSRNQSDKNWYKVDADTRKTDAIDNYNVEQEAPKGSRVQIDEEMKNNNYETNNKLTRTKMDSTTPTMGIGIEETADGNTKYGITSIETETDGDKFVPKGFGIKNVDFGIVERARQDMSLTKRVATMKVTLANGQVIADLKVDENGKISGQRDHITYMKPSNSNSKDGFIKLELDNELLQGTIIEVGYEIKATNNSEKDYISENFYKYGMVEGELVTITPSAIIDYLDNNWAFDSDKNTGWEVKTLEEIQNDKLVADVVYNNEKSNINSKTILYTENLKNENIEPTKSASTMLNVSKTLATTDEINLDNEVESIQVDKKGGSKLTTIPGNYVPGSTEHEKDDSVAETTIVTPSTGNNLAFLVPITVGIVALAILGGGVVLIKKKVLNKDKK